MWRTEESTRGYSELAVHRVVRQPRMINPARLGDWESLIIASLMVYTFGLLFLTPGSQFS